MKAVGGHRRGVDEPADARGDRGLEHVARALEVDALGLLAPAHDDEREVHDDVRAVEQRRQRVAIEHVTPAVLGLLQSLRGGIEIAPRHRDDASDLAAAVERAEQRAADITGRARDRDGQTIGCRRHQRPPLGELLFGGPVIAARLLGVRADHLEPALGDLHAADQLVGAQRPAALELDEVAADLEVVLPGEVRGVDVCGQAREPRLERHGVRRGVDPNPAVRAVDVDRDAHREGKPVGRDEREDRRRVARAEFVDPRVPRRDAALGCGMEALGLLGMAGADLLHVGVEQLGFGRDVRATPHVHPLGPDVDVDPGVVPAEEALERVRRLELGGARQLLDRLSPVPLTVGVKIVIVDVRRALDEHHRGAGEAAAVRLGEQQ